MSTTQQKFPVYMADQREFFDELVSTEWHTYQSQRWNLTRQFEIERLFAHVHPRRIIDIGCGCGYSDVLMAERAGVEEVVGVDYSQRSIDVANATYPHPRVRRFVSDVFSLADGDWDLATSFQLIEHLSDPVAFLQACARQVRPGGWVVATTPNPLRLQNRLLRAFGRAPALVDPQHWCEYSHRELSVLGTRAGLAMQASFGYGGSLVLPKVRWQVVPKRVACLFGYRWPAYADCVCVIFRR